MNPTDLRKLPSSREVYLCRDLGYFPVLVSPAENEILAVVRGGAGHVGVTGRLDAIRSTDRGQTWQKPKIIVNSEVDDRNPGVGVAADGSVILAYHRQGSYDEQGRWAAGLNRVEMMITRSRDRGVSWETPFPLNHEPMKKSSAYGKIVALPDGTLLLPLYTWDTRAQQKADECAVLLRSHDNGKTWGDPTVIAAGHNETGLLLLPNGDLLAAMRTQQKGQRLAVPRSSDRGYTWSEPVDITGEKEHPADLALLSNGWVLMVFGVRHAPHGVQAMISRDGGRTWEARRFIITDDLGQNDLGYPSTVRLGDRLVTAYYCAPPVWGKPEFRGEGSFARALLFSEKELVQASGG